MVQINLDYKFWAALHSSSWMRTMKFRVVFFSFLILLQDIHASDYKFLKMENCSSSNINTVELEMCALTAIQINIVYNIKRPLNKITVRRYWWRSRFCEIACLFSVWNPDFHQKERRVSSVFQNPPNELVLSHVRIEDFESVHASSHRSIQTFWSKSFS